MNTEATVTSTGTTTLGFTATATAYGHTVVETAGRKTVQRSCQKTTASGVFPSGAAYPSRNGSAASGVFPTGIKPSGSGYYPPSGTAITPSGTGVSHPSEGNISFRDCYQALGLRHPSSPPDYRIPSGTGQSIYPLGTTSTPPPSSVIGSVYPTGTGPNYPSGTGSSAPFWSIRQRLISPTFEHSQPAIRLFSSKSDRSSRDCVPFNYLSFRLKLQNYLDVKPVTSYTS